MHYIVLNLSMAIYYSIEYTPSVIYCPRVLRDIILLVLKDAHVMCSGVADRIQPYTIEIVVDGANLKTAYFRKFSFLHI